MNTTYNSGVARSRGHAREHADVLEQADNRDLKSCALWACEFKSHHRHQLETEEIQPKEIFLRMRNFWVKHVGNHKARMRATSVISDVIRLAFVQ